MALLITRAMFVRPGLRKLMGVEELTDDVAVLQVRATAGSNWEDPSYCCICCDDNSPFDEDEEEAGSESEDEYPTGSESAAWVRNHCRLGLDGYASTTMKFGRCQC